MKPALHVLMIVSCMALRALAAHQPDTRSDDRVRRVPAYDWSRGTHIARGRSAVPFDSVEVARYATAKPGAWRNFPMREMNHYGLTLAYQKQLDAAEEVLALATKKWPESYAACDYYGTVLEANGKYAQALTWLEKAVDLHPDSHGGSEWIHFNILKSKIAGDTAILGSQLTGHDFGLEDIPAPGMLEGHLIDLMDQIHDQLNERMTFSDPEDPYVAALLMELGNCCLMLGYREEAVANYESAQRYGLHSQLLTRRLWLAQSHERADIAFPVQSAAPVPAQESEPAPEPYTQPDTTTGAALAIGGGAGMALLLILYYALRRKARRAPQAQE